MTDMVAVRWWRRLTPFHLILVLPYWGLAIGASKPLGDNSFLWHVRAGTAQIDLGAVLRSDPFSFIYQGTPWRTQSWLVELAYGLMERWTKGLSWVPGMLVVVGGLTLSLVALAAYRRSSNLPATALVMAGLAVLALSFEVPRPVLFSFLLLSLVVLALDMEASWLVPFVIWIWASVHGSWIIGLGYVLLESLASKRQIRQVARYLGPSLLLVNLTAHGVGVWSVLLAFFQSRRALDLMTEWHIPDITSPIVIPFTIGIVILFWGATRGRMTGSDTWVVVPFVLFGLTAGRSLMPAAVVLAPWVAQLSSPAKRVGVRRNSVTESWLTLLVGVLLVLVPLVSLVASRPKLDEGRFPVFAVKELGSGRVWHDDAAGGYLIYFAWPEREVFVDDRAELYGFDYMSEYVKSRQGSPGWEELLASYEIDQALVRSGEGLATVLGQAGWTQMYENNQWEVWTNPRR